jgi:glycosyltransferase involved in cell wall biosynthesis
MATKTLVLNMIVKNESRIIERLLNTVAPIIDAYCICDTGSTDNTKELIEKFMAAKGIRGEVFEEPFKNFGYNRSVALDRAAKWGDYALLLDADMKLVIGPAFTKEFFKHEGYLMLQGSSAFEYFNTRIVKLGIGVKCVCPTHEYYDFPGGTTHNLRLPRDFLRIDDIGDGGCKADKFTRDIRLLKEGLTEEPTNGRYHFYIANSYRDMGQHKEAIEWYKKRVALGGWHEEVWNSLYEMGKCHFATGDAAQGTYTLLEAYNYHPARAEPLHEITLQYRLKGKNTVAQLICDKAKTIPYPSQDVLFIKRDVYDYLLEYEQSILSYYSKQPVNHRKYLELLSTGYNRDNVLSNYGFYVRSLNKLPGLLKKRVDWSAQVEREVRGKLDSFKSSSPCIIPFSEGYLMNVRYVNYNLDKHHGTYSYRHDDQKIITLNKALVLSHDLEVVKEHWMDQVHREDIRYLGVEDVKVFSHEGELRFMGTVQDEQGRPRIGEGPYSLHANVLVPQVYPSPVNAGCEKNWVYFHHQGALKVVYNWSPLTVGVLKDGVFQEEQKIKDVPGFFRDVRGSTNGCLVPAVDGLEIWFLTHYVAYSTPRHYYHCIVVLDAKTLAMKRHSTLFKFEGEKIEYALGLIVEADRLLMTYSKWDAESILAVYDRAAFENEFF